MGEFIVTIHIGNIAMSKNSDVQKALQQVIEKLDYVYCGSIMDENGNRVRTFEYRG